MSTGLRLNTPLVAELMHQELSYVSLIQQYGYANSNIRPGSSDSSPGHSAYPTSRSKKGSTELALHQYRIAAFTDDLPTSRASEDFSFLMRKGALHIPDLSVRIALIRAYIKYVRSWMPVLDLRSLSSCIEDDGESISSKISILLL